MDVEIIIFRICRLKTNLSLECGCGFNDIFETKDDAINRWNERVMQYDIKIKRGEIRWE